MLEIPPPLSFGRVGRLYNTTLLKIYTTIYDPICHRDIRPLEHQNPRRPYNAAQAKETRTLNDQNAHIRSDFHSIAEDLFQLPDDMTLKDFKIRHGFRIQTLFPDLNEDTQSTQGSTSTTVSRRNSLRPTPSLR